MLDSANFILDECSREYYWRGTGLLSIKSFWGGQALYEIRDGAFLVDDQSYLILNHGQEYSITIDSETAVSSFCVFFASGFAESVYRDLTSSTELLLDRPGEMRPSTSLFFQRTHAHDLLLSPRLNHLRESFPQRRHDPGWVDEQFHLLMQQLLYVHERTCGEIASIPAVRAATRTELYRRLHLARDYMAASYSQPITLDDVARTARLSPNHLLRTFKQAFGATPHQFLTEVRLKQARRLLTTTERPITDICLEVGFESLGSFSWLFRRRFGMSASAFRLLNR